MITKEEYEVMMEAIRRLEKSGTLKEFLSTTSKLSEKEAIKTIQPPSISEGFHKISDKCMLKCAQYLSKVNAELQLMKYYSSYCDDLYRDYKNEEQEIKNPDILKFIKDYEDYYYKGGEE